MAKLGKKEFIKIISREAKDIEEKRVGILLANLELEFSGCGDKTKITDVGQVDLVFRDNDEKLIFLVEVSKEKRASDKILAFFSKWSNLENLKALSTKLKLPPWKIVRIYFDLSERSQINPKESLKSALGDQTNHVIYLDDLEYFEDSYDKIGLWCRNDLYSFIDLQTTPESTKTIPGIQFQINNQTAYLFADKVSNILKYCYVYRRRSFDLGYQRTLNPKRVGQILKSIKNSSALTFPSSIFITSQVDLCSNKKEVHECPAAVTMKLSKSFAAYRVIDGQHRLLGFSKLNKDEQEKYSLSIVAIEKLDAEEEVKAFIDINSKQKRIDPNLILLLKADWKWDKITNPENYLEKIAVNIVKELNRHSELQNKIYFGEANEKKGKLTTLATLVSVMIKNNFISSSNSLFQKDIDDITTPATTIRQLFGFLEKYMKKKGTKDTFFYRNQGLRILFRYVQLLQRNKEKKYIATEIEDWIKYLVDLVDTNFEKKLMTYYGEGGARSAVRLIMSRVKSKHNVEFKKVKYDLRLL